MIDEASITQDKNGHDNVESFFNSVRLGVCDRRG